MLKGRMSGKNIYISCNGYAIGWNVGEASDQVESHVHLHVMPRYNDEPLAGRGLRYFLKQEDNRRRSYRK